MFSSSYVGFRVLTLRPRVHPRRGRIRLREFRIADRDGFGWPTEPADRRYQQTGDFLRQPSAMAVAACAMQTRDMRGSGFTDHDNSFATRGAWDVFRSFEPYA
jgi:hypothetical protein